MNVLVLTSVFDLEIAKGCDPVKQDYLKNLRSLPNLLCSRLRPHVLVVGELAGAQSGYAPHNTFLLPDDIAELSENGRVSFLEDLIVFTDLMLGRGFWVSKQPRLFLIHC